jgi:hypothetical protein
MANSSAFTQVDPALFSVLEELRQREPIFHTPHFGTAQTDFENATAPEYWEVGASGRRYSRDFILQTLKQNPRVDAVTAKWQSSDFGLRRLGSDVYLLTYTLRQEERVTRRATIWQSTAAGWRILYHQGTLVTAEEDDVAPSSSAVPV